MANTAPIDIFRSKYWLVLLGLFFMLFLSGTVEAATSPPTAEQTGIAGSNVLLTLTNLQVNDQIEIFWGELPVGTIIATSSMVELTVPIPSSATPGDYVMTTRLNQEESTDHPIKIVAAESRLVSWRTQLIILLGILMVICGAGLMTLHADHRPWHRRR